VSKEVKKRRTEPQQPREPINLETEGIPKRRRIVPYSMI